jgi:hypothetical protein
MTYARTDAMSVCWFAHFMRARPSSTSSSKLCPSKVGFFLLAGLAQNRRSREVRR